VIEFDEPSHRYTVDGREFPSVTGILEPYTGLSYVDRELLHKAAEFGNHVHLACHLHDRGELDEATLDQALVPYLDGWKRFLDDSGAIVILSEYRVASRKHGFAGTFDKLLFWGKSERLADIKSGSVLPKTVGPQTAGYVEGYAEETGQRIRDRYCIHLPGDGKYKSHKLTDARDWSIFKSCLNVHNWYHRRAA
jgi:hypothetical protein